MASDVPWSACVHDLRVLVSSIRLLADDVMPTPGAAQDAHERMREQIDLLAEVLRLLSVLEGDEEGFGEVDARAIVWMARTRQPEAFMGKMPIPVWVRTNVRTLLDLVDVVVAWVRASVSRVKIVAVPRPPALFIVAAPVPGESIRSVPHDRETEQTILSLASAAHVEVSLRASPRSATIEFLSGGSIAPGEPEDDDG